MNSPVIKRSIVIAGHKTSVSLEDAFWNSLKEIAGERGMTLSDLVASIDTARSQGNLSSAIRLFVLDYYRARLGNSRSAAQSRGASTLGAASFSFAPRLTPRVVFRFPAPAKA